MRNNISGKNCVISQDYRRFPKDFRRFPNISEDFPKTSEDLIYSMSDLTISKKLRFIELSISISLKIFFFLIKIATYYNANLI